MNDPVVERECRIDEKTIYSAMTRAEGEAVVDAELAHEEAMAHAYLSLINAIREQRHAA